MKQSNVPPNTYFKIKALRQCHCINKSHKDHPTLILNQSTAIMTFTIETLLC